MGRVPGILLTPDQFVSRAVGVPWQRWQSDWTSCDCYGLITLYFREVLGIELGDVPRTDLATGFAETAGWEECGAEAGATAWMAWLDGAPRHCGIVLPDCRLLHSEGDDGAPGNVRVSRLAAVERFYGPIRFYRYGAC